MVNHHAIVQSLPRRFTKNRFTILANICRICMQHLHVLQLSAYNNYWFKPFKYIYIYIYNTYTYKPVIQIYITFIHT